MDADQDDPEPDVLVLAIAAVDLVLGNPAGTAPGLATAAADTGVTAFAGSAGPSSSIAAAVEVEAGSDSPIAADLNHRDSADCIDCTPSDSVHRHFAAEPRPADSGNAELGYAGAFARLQLAPSDPKRLL